MNFDFSDDQKLLGETARNFLAERGGLAVCRRVLESREAYAADLWKRCAEMGWTGTRIPESYGGSGFGYLELAVVAEEAGRTLAPLPLASSVYLATEAILLAGSDEQKRAYLPRLAAGDAIGCFGIAERAGIGAVDGVESSFSGERLSGSKQAVLGGDAATFAVVLAREGGGSSLAIVDLDAPGVSRRRIESIDPSRPLARIEFDDVSAKRLGAPGAGAELAASLLDRAAVLVAFEQIGGATAAFEITREFTLGRYAFGKPIASFQAIKHRLADHWCAIELARSNAYYAAWALEKNAEDLPAAACVARVGATTAFERMSIDMIQLHGGVGYTWEYDCHLFYRRAKLLAAALGPAAEWRDRLIERLAATNQFGDTEGA